MRKHTHVRDPVRSILRTYGGYPRHIVHIKNALWACGYNLRSLRGYTSIHKFLGMLPKPELERILTRLT